MDESETRPGVSVYLVSRPRQDRESRHSVQVDMMDQEVFGDRFNGEQDLLKYYSKLSRPELKLYCRDRSAAFKHMG